MSNFVVFLSDETKPITMRKELVDLVTRMPDCVTCAGKSGTASCSLFCTWTCAMSGLVPGAKVRVVVDWPVSSLCESR